MGLGIKNFTPPEPKLDFRQKTGGAPQIRQKINQLKFGFGGWSPPFLLQVKFWLGVGGGVGQILSPLITIFYWSEVKFQVWLQSIKFELRYRVSVRVGSGQVGSQIKLRDQLRLIKIKDHHT